MIRVHSIDFGFPERMTLVRIAVWFGITMLAGSLTATAQFDDAQREQFAAEIRDAAERVDDAAFPTLDQATRDVMSQITATESFFRGLSDAANADAWIAYLDVAELVRLIDSDAEPTAIAREAIDVGYRLVGTTPGLELSTVVDLRESLQRLVNSVRFRDSKRSKDLITKQLRSLADSVAEMDDVPSAEDAQTLGAVVTLLGQSGQSPELIASIRRRFARPNLAILVGESLVQSVVNRSVQQSRPVRDCILGTRIVGDASLSGQINVDLQPSWGSVQLLVSLDGQVVSRNTGYNGPVRLRTTGFGQVRATRVVNITPTGLVSGPVGVNASLQTQINSIDHKLRIVRRIARKRAAKQKPKADRIALAKLESQVANSFAQQTDEVTSMPIDGPLGRLRPLLKRLSLDEPIRLIGSTDDAITLDATLRRDDQLGALQSRPPVRFPLGTAVQIHESLIDNALSPVLAGRTVREGDLNSLLASSGLDLQRPEPSSKTPNEKAADGEESDDDPTPFEIDFSRLRPIIFEARDQTLRIGVRGTRFVQGKRELKRTIEITAVYQPARLVDGRTILLRQDDVDVSFPGGGDRLSVTQIGLRRTIQRKFDDVFPETLLDRTITIPASAKLQTLRGREFTVRHVDAQDGWLTVQVD